MNDMTQPFLLSLRLFVLTWNVHENAPVHNIGSLLNLNGFNATGKLPDLYVIGLQETGLNSACGVMNKYCNAHQWKNSFDNTLKDYNYVGFDFVRLQGIVLYVFYQQKLKNLFQDVRTDTKTTGFAHIVGNKGAVALRFNILGVNVCLINSHLKAHDENLMDRISMYEEITKGISFDVSGYEKILYHDYVFWFGDLNFRLGGNLTPKEIEQYVKDNRFNQLLEQDQLRTSIQSRKVFTDFKEGLITFRPTFKYDKGSQNYNLKRRPAWTDRILYRTGEGKAKEHSLQVIQQNYTSRPEYDVSDHKPVIARFEIAVKREIPAAG